MPRTSKQPGSAAEDGAIEYRIAFKDVPLELRPRERLQHSGPASLSDAELLAIILRTGTRGAHVLDFANRLLARLGGLVGMDRASLVELAREPGLGPAKATEIKAALELGRRLVSRDPEQRAQIRSPADIWQLVRSDMSRLEQEHLRVLLLNTKNQVLAAPDLYRGSVNSTTVRLAEVFREAVRQNATAIALVHNHPSGDPSPSREDVQLTRDAVEAGKLLEVEVVDHVIVGSGDKAFVSLRERGLGFSAAR